jgi:Mg2+ and Co2+ transporter CorA
MQLPHAYLVAFIGTIIATALTYWYFRKKKWF